MKRISIMVIGLFIAVSLSVQAATDYWNDGVYDGNWNDPANWSLGHVPDSTDDTAAFTKWKNVDTPFTVSFTNDVTAKLSLGYGSVIAGMNVVTFDLNGHTFTHTNATLDVHGYIDWTIIDGTLETSGGQKFTQGYYQVPDWVARVTVGTNAVFKFNPPDNNSMRIGEKAGADFVVKDGGQLITDVLGDYAVQVGNSTGTGYTNYTATITVTGEGSVWSNLAGRIYLGNHALATAKLVVEDGGKMVNKGDLFRFCGADNSRAEVEVISGGLLDLRGQTSTLSIGHEDGSTGILTVSGAGSEVYYDLAPLYLSYNPASSGTCIIDDGGLFEKHGVNQSLYVGYLENTQGDLQVRNGGTFLWAASYGTIKVSGKTVSGRGTMTVTGTNSIATMGELLIAQNQGTGTVTVADGGRLESYRTIYMGRLDTNYTAFVGEAKMVITGAGSVVAHSTLTDAEIPDAKISDETHMGVGGGGFRGWNDDGLIYYKGYGPGGKGHLTIEDGGLLDINGDVSVYSNSTIRIDGGRSQTAKIGMEVDSVLNAVLRQADANGTALMTATSMVRLWGPTLDLELGSDFERVNGDVYTLISGTTIEASYDRFSYDGATLEEGAIVTVGRERFMINYSTTDITLTVLPPQGTVILIL